MFHISPENKPKNLNDVVYELAKRSKELADEKMDYLRLVLTSDPEGRVGPTREEFIGFSKGDLIELILVEEFVEDEPLLVEETHVS